MRHLDSDSTGIGLSTWWRAKTSNEKKKKELISNPHPSLERGWHTLKNLEVLKIGVFRVHVEFYSGHGNVHYETIVSVAPVPPAQKMLSARRRSQGNSLNMESKI